VFGGSFFGESPFASPPFVGAARRIVKWIAGKPGSLWSLMRARSRWETGAPTDSVSTRKPTEDIVADTPRENWKTGDL
jgi:hypothetical protein